MKLKSIKKGGTPAQIFGGPGLFVLVAIWLASTYDHSICNVSPTYDHSICNVSYDMEHHISTLLLYSCRQMTHATAQQMGRSLGRFRAVQSDDP